MTTQAIAYKVNGQPQLKWPTEIELETLDADGNPTGDSRITDNLEELIAALPEGTKYEIIDEADAEAWWEANQPAEEKIKAAIAALEATQTPRMVRGAALGNPEDKAMLAEIEEKIAALRVELAGLAT